MLLMYARKDDDLQAIGMKDDQVWTPGMIVFVNSSNLAYNPTASLTITAGDTFAGIADKNYDNTDGGDAGIYGNAWRKGAFQFPVASVSGTKKVGSRIAIDANGALAVTTAVEYKNIIGVIVGFEGTDPVISITKFVDKKFDLVFAEDDVPVVA